MMKEKLIKRLYDFWVSVDENDNTDLLFTEEKKETEINKELLLKQITELVNNNNAEQLLDWCRSEYDLIKLKYMNIHNINETEMEKLMEDNFGDYSFMYKEIGYVAELDKVWDLCNWFLDYVNGTKSEEYLLNEIENY